MKVTLTSTSKIVMMKPGLMDNGIPVRVWEGETDTGIKCHAFVTRIALDRNENAEQFERELMECEVPSAEIQAIPNRLIL